MNLLFYYMKTQKTLTQLNKEIQNICNDFKLEISFEDYKIKEGKGLRSGYSKGDFRIGRTETHQDLAVYYKKFVILYIITASTQESLKRIVDKMHADSYLVNQLELANGDWEKLKKLHEEYIKLNYNPVKLMSKLIDGCRESETLGAYTLNYIPMALKSRENRILKLKEEIKEIQAEIEEYKEIKEKYCI